MPDWMTDGTPDPAPVLELSDVPAHKLAQLHTLDLEWISLQFRQRSAPGSDEDSSSATAPAAAAGGKAATALPVHALLPSLRMLRLQACEVCCRCEDMSDFQALLQSSSSLTHLHLRSVPFRLRSPVNLGRATAISTARLNTALHNILKSRCQCTMTVCLLSAPLLVLTLVLCAGQRQPGCA